MIPREQGEAVFELNALEWIPVVPMHLRDFCCNNRENQCTNTDYTLVLFSYRENVHKRVLCTEAESHL